MEQEKVLFDELSAKTLKLQKDIGPEKWKINYMMGTRYELYRVPLLSKIYRGRKF
jgi:hypothetical protein